MNLYKIRRATICCTDGQNNPYCFICFYVFDSASCRLYFKSSDKARHCHLLGNNPQVAGTIVPDKPNLLSMKGIQFSGSTLNTCEAEMQYAWKLYHAKFPFALTISGVVYCIALDVIKMTDNSKGFGKKITWVSDKTPGVPLLP